MGSQLLNVHPLELRFVVEEKKQSSCSIQLINKSDQYVAFKVKTTSPKKYCVRPNVGIIKPNETSNFTVTMQVQRAAAIDLQCKDKFLVQGTVVTSETTEEDLTNEMFTKGSGRHIEERKMRVILVPSAQPSVLAPVNGATNQDASDDTSQKEKIPTALSDTSQREKTSSGVENLPPSEKITQEPEGSKVPIPVEASTVSSDADTTVPASTQDPGPTKSTDTKESKTAEEIKSPSHWIEELKKQAEDMKLKIDILGPKLSEAEQTVAKLTDERSKVMHEKERSKRELALVKRKFGARSVHVGFPLLYICMVALICLTVGYMMQPPEIDF